MGGTRRGWRAGRGWRTGLATAERALARLGIGDLLAAGPQTSEELASDAGADADALNRVLGAASVYGLVRRDNDWRWTLTKAGDLLRSDSELSARYLAAGFLGPALWAAGSRIEQIVRGATVDPASPGGTYEWFGQHPQEATWFARAMGRITGEMVAELQTSGFRPLASGRIIDVGGSRGTLLAHLLRSDPQSTGVLFDRAEALADAPGFLASAGVADRAEVVPGSFLDGVPADGDLYVLSQVLHNWDDERVRIIVGNCALPNVLQWPASV